MFVEWSSTKRIHFVQISRFDLLPFQLKGWNAELSFYSCSLNWAIVAMGLWCCLFLRNILSTFSLPFILMIIWWFLTISGLFFSALLSKVRLKVHSNSDSNNIVTAAFFFWISQFRTCSVIHVSSGTDKEGILGYFWLFLHKNICWGYSLESPWWGDSNEYP